MQFTASFLAVPLHAMEALGGRGSIAPTEGRGVHVTGVSAAYTFKLNKNILSE
jgi:hypothetical protein